MNDNDRYYATISEVRSGYGVRLLFGGSSSPTVKYYKQASSAGDLSVGDKVICLKKNGTYIVISKLAKYTTPDPTPDPDPDPTPDEHEGEIGFTIRGVQHYVDENNPTWYTWINSEDNTENYTYYDSQWYSSGAIQRSYRYLSPDGSAPSYSIIIAIRTKSPSASESQATTTWQTIAEGYAYGS